MIRSIIIDDERRSRETLQSLLARYCPEVDLLGSAESVATGIESIRSYSPNLVFLDIEMPYANGFELLEHTRGERFEVIFTTAYDRYAIRAIKLCALDYLMKPIDRDELIAAVGKARRKLEPQEQISSYVGAMLEKIRGVRVNRIPLPTSDGIIFTEPENIIRCEAQGNYTTIWLKGAERLLIARTLKEFDDILTPIGFFRVHNAHLVSLQHIRKYVRGDGGYIIMCDGTRVDVSRRRREELMKKLAEA
jgi:two-component system, LytTR family, response regulator